MSTAQESQAAEITQASAQSESAQVPAAPSRPAPASSSTAQATQAAQAAQADHSQQPAKATNTTEATQAAQAQHPQQPQQPQQPVAAAQAAQAAQPQAAATRPQQTQQTQAQTQQTHPQHPQHPTSPKRIRIFVAAHTPATFPDCASIMPIQVGAEPAERQGRPLFEETLHDNDGEHISELNPMYSELTAMYWAWKNADADYFGFCQYRRYLDFASTPQAPHAEDDHGEVPAEYIDAQSIAEYGLDDGTIAHAVEGWDVATGPLVDVRRLNGFMTLKEQWAADPHLRLRDLRHMYDVLCARHPEYRADADAVLDGHTLVTNNMFVMRRGLFRAYCAWLFPLLEEFTGAWDHAHADVETLRTPGHLAERLLTIWLAHLARVGVASDESGEPVPADVVSSVPSVDASRSSDAAIRLASTRSDAATPGTLSGTSLLSSDSAHPDSALPGALSVDAALSPDSAHPDSALPSVSPTITATQVPTPTPAAVSTSTPTATPTPLSRPLKLKRLQCVRFAHPEPFLPLEPLDANPRFTVPVIFAADDDYVPVLATAVTSMLRNANPDRHYDVIVLERDITQENQRTLAAFLDQFPNATIRFYDVGRAIAGYHLPEDEDSSLPSRSATSLDAASRGPASHSAASRGPASRGPAQARTATQSQTAVQAPNTPQSQRKPQSPTPFKSRPNTPISPETLATDHRLAAETCYRFVIQDALPFYSKVLYLDCDVVVNGDIAELYDTDLEGSAVGAVPDVDFLGNLNMKDGRTAAYASGPDSRLHMRDPFGYFQTGVLLMDLERMRDLHSVDEWLRLARSPRFLHHDQDVLNMECEGDVRYLPFEWNVLHNCGDRMHGVFDFAPAEAFLGYVESRKNPKIVHYAGFDKPWTNPWCDFGPLYWSYARTTPFSLQVMAMLADVDKPKPATFHERAIAEDHPMRKYVDKVAPLGSRQREVIKVIARKMQGKQ